MQLRPAMARHKKARKVLLELGPGKTPVLKRGLMLDYDLPLLQDLRRKLGDRADYVLANYSKGIPLKDKSISRIEARIPLPLDLDEVKRVLKKGGTFTISIPKSVEKDVKKDLEELGFKLTASKNIDMRKATHFERLFGRDESVVILRFKKL